MNFQRQPDKTTKMSDGITLNHYKELTEDKTDLVETIVAKDESGREVVCIVKKGKDVISTEATTDAQSSGLFEKVCKKAGLDADQIVYTKPSMIVAKAGVDEKKASKKIKDDASNHKAEKMKLLGKSDVIKFPAPKAPQEEVASNTMKLFEAVKRLTANKNTAYDGKEPPYIDDDFKSRLAELTAPKMSKSAAGLFKSAKKKI